MSPSSRREISIIALVALALVTLALVALTFLVTLIVVVITALAVAIHRRLLFTTIAHPPAACHLSADAGPTAASQLPVEPLLPIVALYFIMVYCYSSHWHRHSSLIVVAAIIVAIAL